MRAVRSNVFNNRAYLTEVGLRTYDIDLNAVCLHPSTFEDWRSPSPKDELQFVVNYSRIPWVMPAFRHARKMQVSRRNVSDRGGDQLEDMAESIYKQRGRGQCHCSKKAQVTK